MKGVKRVCERIKEESQGWSEKNKEIINKILEIMELLQPSKEIMRLSSVRNQWR